MTNQTTHLPIYPHSAAYAQEHGEKAQYRASYQANIACKNEIERAIAQYFDGMHLDERAVQSVLDAYGAERTLYVLANTIQRKDWDPESHPRHSSHPYRKQT